MNTWNLVPCPIKHKVIKSKWVFKPKLCLDGSVHNFKACLVVMGYAQVKGINFEKVFDPTTRFKTLRLILCLLGSEGWGGYQIDFTAAFLNGDLDEPTYMSQPPGYKDPEHPNYVCEVKKLLYSLKQSPKQWNKVVHKVVISLVLTKSKFHPTLYFKVVGGKLICAFAVHVDDISIADKESSIQPLMDSHEKK